ncbi:MAG: metalloregulator ArsR/SmtB family transcription factor [Desulfobacterales bacterium]|nr:metalloregulator ArsR/SmtB family transcription factor [Desulfobacterales bacterium]
MMENSPYNNAPDTCITKGIHKDIIHAVQNKLPDSGLLHDLADLFKLFGDSTRISILWALSESEMCVCDLCALLKMKQPAVSHQLKNLKQARIVKSRRDGQVVFYSLDDEHIRKLMDLGMGHIREPQFDQRNSRNGRKHIN